MIFRKTLCILACVLLAASAIAQIDPDPDGIGIYFDQAATQVTTTAAVGEEVTAYLIATNASAGGNLGFWQAYVSASIDEVIIWGAAGDGFNVATNMPPGGPGFSFIIMMNEPYAPLLPVHILGTLSILVPTVEPIGLFVPGLPYYRVDDPYSQDYTLYPASGSADLPVAVINGEAPVAAETQSWGAVKSLYR